MINLKYIALLSDTLLGGGKKIKAKKKPIKKTMKKKHRKIKYDSSSSDSSSSSSDSTIYRTKKDKEKEIIFVPVETQPSNYYVQNNNLTPVKLNPSDNITFLGMLNNNTPYQCNPEYYVNKESFFNINGSGLV